VKSWDGVTLPSASTVPGVVRAKSGCTGCRALPLLQRVQMIQVISRDLVTAHAGLADVYESIAEEQTDPREAGQYYAAAERSRSLAQMAAMVTVPDGPEPAAGDEGVGVVAAEKVT